jgi:hypothetical protein
MQNELSQVIRLHCRSDIHVPGYENLLHKAVGPYGTNLPVFALRRKLECLRAWQRTATI